MQPDLIAQLDAAVQEVFHLMLGRLCLPSLTPSPTTWGFTAAVLFRGSLTGACTVHLDTESAASLAQDLIGETSEALAADTVGELCNMIAGTWKSRLQGLGAACTLSAPTITPGPTPESTRIYTFDTHSHLTLNLTLA